jgi:hypothetical protein
MTGDETPSTDWAAWHEAYADPASDLAHRLATVVTLLTGVLDALPAGPARLISACAGQGHDVVAALGGHDRAPDVTGLLVEVDPGLSAASRRALDDVGLPAIRTVCGDASMTDAYLGVAPAEVVLLCGIFGNVADVDVRTTVSSARMLCAPGGHVVWTRHRRDPDLTPRIRGWFSEGDFDEVAFESPGPGRFAVGLHRYAGEAEPLRPGIRMFTFTR